MKCKKCGSENMVLIEKTTGVHNSLYCSDCLAFQKFLSKKDAKFYKILGGKTA